MRNLLIKFLFLFVIPLSFISCDKNDDDESTAPTFDAYVSSNSQLTMFAKAVDKAGLQSFKSGVGPFTWFAPTNEAFLAASITEDSLNRMSVSQISYLMLYHLANADLSASNMIGLNSTPRQSQLGTSGTNFQFFIGTVNDESYINGSKIISRDNKISNGYVHVINRFNTPPALRGNIQGILNSTGQHALFIRALQRAALWTSFGTTSVFTVFAPTDAAMQAAGYTSTSIAAATPASLSAVLRYHYLLNTRLFTNDLIKQTLPATAAGTGSFLTTSDNGTKIKGKNNPTPASIIQPDLLGTNGVVHVIDQVLKP